MKLEHAKILVREKEGDLILGTWNNLAKTGGRERKEERLGASTALESVLAGRLGKTSGEVKGTGRWD